MNTDDNIGAPLSFGTAIDMSGFDEGAKQIEERVSEIGNVAEAQSARINELLTNIPTVNIDIVPSRCHRRGSRVRYRCPRRPIRSGR